MAVRELEAYSGVKWARSFRWNWVRPIPCPVVTAARLGISLIDGDYSGRAVPQEMQTTYFLKGLSITRRQLQIGGEIVSIIEGASRL